MGDLESSRVGRNVSSRNEDIGLAATADHTPLPFSRKWKKITGFKGARFRRFDTREEAELYIRGENPISPTDEGYSLETMAEAEHLSHVLCFAGVCQTDPGPSAAAAAIYHRAANIGHPRPVWRDVKFLPHSTATEADYKGLLVGLQAASARGIRELSIIGDSRLVIGHLTGSLMPHPELNRNEFWRALEIVQGLERFEAVRITRSQNQGVVNMGLTLLSNRMRVPVQQRGPHDFQRPTTRFYVVSDGREGSRVCCSWLDCKAGACGKPNARCRVFHSLSAAQGYLASIGSRACGVDASSSSTGCVSPTHRNTAPSSGPESGPPELATSLSGMATTGLLGAPLSPPRGTRFVAQRPRFESAPAELMNCRGRSPSSSLSSLVGGGVRPGDDLSLLDGRSFHSAKIDVASVQQTLLSPATTLAPPCSPLAFTPVDAIEEAGAALSPCSSSGGGGGNSGLDEVCSFDCSPDSGAAPLPGSLVGAKDGRLTTGAIDRQESPNPSLYVTRAKKGLSSSVDCAHVRGGHGPRVHSSGDVRDQLKGASKSSSPSSITATTTINSGGSGGSGGIKGSSRQGCIIRQAHPRPSLPLKPVSSTSQDNHYPFLQGMLEMDKKRPRLTPGPECPDPHGSRSRSSSSREGRTTGEEEGKGKERHVSHHFHDSEALFSSRDILRTQSQSPEAGVGAGVGLWGNEVMEVFDSSQLIRGGGEGGGTALGRNMLGRAHTTQRKPVGGGGAGGGAGGREAEVEGWRAECSYGTQEKEGEGKTEVTSRAQSNQEELLVMMEAALGPHEVDKQERAKVLGGGGDTGPTGIAFVDQAETKARSEQKLPMTTGAAHNDAAAAPLPRPCVGEAEDVGQGDLFSWDSGSMGGGRGVGGSVGSWLTTGNEEEELFSHCGLPSGSLVDELEDFNIFLEVASSLEVDEGPHTF